MLILNLKSDFQKNLNKFQKIAKTKKHDFYSVYSDRIFVPNQKNFFFEFSTIELPSPRYIKRKRHD